MKLFKVEAAHKIYYDEYDAVVVRAESADDAIAYVNETVEIFPGYTRERYTGLSGRPVEVTEILYEGVRGGILASFNAG